MTTSTTSIHPAHATQPDFHTKAERETWYRLQLATKPAWAMRALEILYNYQTAAEQQSRHTHTHNNVGFSGTHAPILSSMAEQVLRWKAESTHRFPNPLSPKQLVIVQKLIPKYTKQLLAHLEREGKLPPLGFRLVLKPTSPAPTTAPESGDAFDEQV